MRHQLKRRGQGQGAGLAICATLLAVSATFMLVGIARATAITAGGRRLAAVLDSMEVEQHWLRGQPVDWRTGEIDPAARPLKGHCSAFVAAVCATLDLYLLRPPEHDEWLLANAQCAWLAEEGPAQGWTRVEDGIEAQRLANQGRLVLACYQNPERDDPGHIAVVRPCAKSLSRLKAEGPDVTQAGARNYRRTTVRNGFRLHAKAWQRGKLVYYAHVVPAGRADRP
jgi:hypothetical protein